MNLRAIEKRLDDLDKRSRQTHEAVRTLLALAAHRGDIAVRDHAGPDLEEGLWAGRPCFILGSGPTMKDFDYSRLAGHLTIACNRQGEQFDPSIWFSVDTRWLLWTLDGTLGSDARSKLMATKALKLLRRNEGFQPPPGWEQIAEARGERFTLSMEQGLGSIGNTGYAALNLAFLLGANPIYLAGIDMRGAAGMQAWSHDPYPVVASDADAYPFYVYTFREFAAPTLSERGVRVASLTDTALDCFERVDEIPPATTPWFVTCWTPNGRYRDLADRISRNLTRFGLRHEVVALPDTGSWARNCACKPRVIGEAMDRHPGETVVWLDADALVRRFPHLLCDASSFDVAFHLRESTELLSGTLAFSGSALSREIVSAWQAECEANPDVWDQVSLANVLPRFPQAAIRHLPAEYCCISDTMAPRCGQPVVEHFQASRRSNESRHRRQG